jgi:uncharacterized protein YdeI (YjbR/CyaY-like superfamily)
MKVVHFKSATEFRKWPAKHHATERELWVGYYKKETGKGGLTWPESVDEALCYGWIDGVRKKVDEESYTNRFSPRTAKSTWSAINIRRAQELIDAGRMRAAGLAAFESRREYRSGIYSYEQRKDQLDEPYQGRLKRNQKAWAFYQGQTPGYRRLANWWVVSAKREVTRLKRLDQLIELSAQGKTIRELAKKPKAK